MNRPAVNPQEGWVCGLKRMMFTDDERKALTFDTLSDSIVNLVANRVVTRMLTRRGVKYFVNAAAEAGRLHYICDEMRSEPLFEPVRDAIVDDYIKGEMAY